MQTLVPIMLDHVNAGRLSLERFVDLTSHGPNRIFGIAGKGRIAAGYDADFTIVDLKRSETITNAQAGSKAGWTPYDGKRVTGWPVGTIVRGMRVMWDGEIVAPGQGRPVRFSEALPSEDVRPSRLALRKLCRCRKRSAGSHLRMRAVAQRLPSTPRSERARRQTVWSNGWAGKGSCSTTLLILRCEPARSVRHHWVTAPAASLEGRSSPTRPRRKTPTCPVA